MFKLTLGLILLSVVACTTSSQEYDEYYGAGFISVSEALWPFEHTTAYPFTVPYGEISCSFHPSFGREIYFVPKDFTDESYIGTPLNKVAAKSLKHNGMISNVPYSIKKGADLKDAIRVGMRVCDEQQDILNSNK